VKAAVCREFATDLNIEDVSLAEPGPDQVEVTLRAVAICHSDIFFAEGAWGGKLPAIYGHEAAGLVSKVGEGVSDLKTGDPVCVTLIRSCGDCPACHKGARSECDQPWDKSLTPLTGSDGKPIVRAMNCGAFAERVVVSPSQCVVIPATMPFDVASLLSCGVITGVGAVINTANVKPGDTVAVIGAGGVGLNAIQGAAIAGATRVIAIDLLEDKLDAAREFGATHGVNAADTELAATVRCAQGVHPGTGPARQGRRHGHRRHAAGGYRARIRTDEHGRRQLPLPRLFHGTDQCAPRHPLAHRTLRTGSPEAG
jgi:Zn-dependent alcohol dehydrogenase